MLGVDGYIKARPSGNGDFGGLLRDVDDLVDIIGVDVDIRSGSEVGREREDFSL
jgi:hypothetical protein